MFLNPLAPYDMGQNASGSSGLTPEQAEQLDAAAEDAAYIRSRLVAQAGGGNDAVSFELSQPPAPGVARLHFFVRDFGAVGNLSFTVIMEAKHPVVIEGAYEFDRKQQVTTVGGTGYVDVYPSSVLSAAGLNPHYKIQCDPIGLNKRSLVPDGASNAATLDHVPRPAS